MIYCNNIDARYNGTYRNTFNDLQYIDDGTHYNKDFGLLHIRKMREH